MIDQKEFENNLKDSIRHLFQGTEAEKKCLIKLALDLLIKEYNYNQKGDTLVLGVIKESVLVIGHLNG